MTKALTAGGDDNTTARNFMKTGGDDYFLAYVTKGGSVKEDQVTHTTRLMYIVKVQALGAGDDITTARNSMMTGGDDRDQAKVTNEFQGSPHPFPISSYFDQKMG